VHKSKSEILEEIDLIIEAQKNSDKFEIIYEKYYIEIFRFIHRRVSDKDTSADICSQVF